MHVEPDRPRRRSADCVEEAALLVARNPGAAERMLSAHRPDRLGYCTGCGRAHPRWPCALVAVAERARELASVHPAALTLKVVISAPGTGTVHT